MRNTFTLGSVLLSGLLLVTPAIAAEGKEGDKAAPAAAKAEGDVKQEYMAIVTAVKDKLKQGKRSADDLAPELKRFDELLAKHKDEKSEDVAQAAMLRAALYIEVLQDEEKGTALMKQVAADYPETNVGKAVAARLKGMEAQAHLAVGKKFPAFSVTDLDGKPLSIADYKGKVVLIDFWATWCGPCIAELPHVKETYEKHRGSGFDIIGISLDKKDDKDKLTAFIAKNDMSWRHYFDGQGWQNKLAQEYGIQSIPATFLLDGEGMIIGKNLRGAQLEAAVAKAVKKSDK